MRDLTYQGKSTMTTHTVTSNTNTTRIKLRESSKDSLRQLVGDVAVHIIAGIVRSLCSVDVETRAGAEIIRIILAFDVKAACKMLIHPNL